MWEWTGVFLRRQRDLEGDGEILGQEHLKGHGHLEEDRNVWKVAWTSGREQGHMGGERGSFWKEMKKFGGDMGIWHRA